MGWYIIDGMDGCGKNTVADALSAALAKRGRSSHVHTHPSELITGRISRRLLQGEGKGMQAFATVFFILDVLISLARMRRWRAYDDIVFVRYIMAVAYLPDPLVEKGYYLVAKVLPMPEHLILVDTPPEMAMCRIVDRGHDLEMFETVDKLSRIRQRMLRLSSKGWKVLDNSDSMDGIERQVEEYLG